MNMSETSLILIFFLMCIIRSYSQSVVHTGRNLGRTKTPIWQLVREEDIDEIRKFTGNVDGERTLYEDNTALILAAQNGNKEIAELLLPKGAKVDALNHDNETALFRAAKLGRPEILDLLIRRGGNVNIKNNLGRVPLLEAIDLDEVADRKRVAELLLANGANTNMVYGDEGWTPLILAAEKGNKDMIELLLQKGVNVNEVNLRGDTALMQSAYYGHKNTVQLLLQNGANVNAVTNDHETALIKAATGGNTKIVEILIQNGADINARTNGNLTALMHAIVRGHRGVVRLLLRKGADVNAVYNEGTTALMRAVQDGSKDILELLLQYGADVNTADDLNETALIKAAQNTEANRDIVDTLLLNGAEVNATDSKQFTALMWAVIRGNEDIVEMLIQKGSNVDAVSEDESTALFKAAIGGRTEIVKLLLQNGADINIANNDSYTVIMAAASAGNKATMDLLMENGADLNTVSKTYKKSALILAAEKGFYGAVNALLIAGADPDIRDVYGKSAEDWAVEGIFDSLVSIFQASNRACNLYSRHAGMQNDRRNSPALTNEFPWMVAIGYLVNFRLTFDCGGTLISDSFVLTSATCVMNERLPVAVQIGQMNPNNYVGQENMNLNLKDIKKHPKFTPNDKKNDIALLGLIRRVYISDGIKPACLYRDRADLDSNVVLTVTGWISPSAKNVNSPSALLKGNVRTMPLAQCNAMISEHSRENENPTPKSGISESQYCIRKSNGSKNACRTAVPCCKGGPLQLIGNNTIPTSIVGIVSFSSNEGCGGNLPSIYTRVASHIYWIGSIVWPNGEIIPPLVNRPK